MKNASDNAIPDPPAGVTPDPDDADDVSRAAVAVPLPLLMLMVDAMGGWVELIQSKSVQVPTPVQAIAAQIANRTALAVRIWDQHAAAGLLPTRDQAHDVLEELGVPGEEKVDPAVPKLWTPRGKMEIP